MLPSEKATEIVAHRRGVYGHPAEVYKIWRDLCTAIGVVFTLEEASVILLLLKVAREHNGGYDPEYPDNVDDMAGYANVLAMIKEALHHGS